MKNFVNLKQCNDKFTRVYFNDAYIIHFIFKYKMVGENLNIRCAFPSNKIDNITSILEELNISYSINSSNKETSVMKDYKENNKYEEYLNKGKRQINLETKMDILISKLNLLNQDDLDKKLDELLKIM